MLRVIPHLVFRVIAHLRVMPSHVVARVIHPEAEPADRPHPRPLNLPHRLTGGRRPSLVPREPTSNALTHSGTRNKRRILPAWLLSSSKTPMSMKFTSSWAMAVLAARWGNRTSRNSRIFRRAFWTAGIGESNPVIHLQLGGPSDPLPLPSLRHPAPAVHVDVG